MTIIYIVLFTFLDPGYTYLFGEAYNLYEGLTSICWTGMLVGNLLVVGLVPVVCSWTAKACAQSQSSTIVPEIRLWYTMLGGAVAVPISLSWMGWTSNASYIYNQYIYNHMILKKTDSGLVLVAHFNLVTPDCFCSFLALASPQSSLCFIHVSH